MARPSILILGGGISGVTCGVVLQALGFQTRIVCQHWLGADMSSHQRLDPRFASAYPAASIIPHTVQVDDISWHMHCGQLFFRRLLDFGVQGIRLQRHFEVFEAPCPIPEYAGEMPEFEELQPGDKTERDAPRRCPDQHVFGWSFRTLFAEMPKYRSFLASLYEELGGTVRFPMLATPDLLKQVPEEVVLNCSGAWSRLLFKDELESRFVRGVLLRVDHGGCMPVHYRTGQPTSYNYHSDSTVYGQPDGTAADVYFYPRSDACLLGGTRHRSLPLNEDDIGQCDPDSETLWRGETYSGEMIQIPAADRPGMYHSVPRPILDLNVQLVQGLTGVDMRRFPVTAMTGLRHQRQQIRLESQVFGSRCVIHNYGHGGAGVTLSWSCAVKVAQMVAPSMGLEEITDAVSRRLKAHVNSGIIGV